MELFLTLALFLVAAFYAAVGLGGGSGYVAVMGIAGVPPEIIRPTALTLNILVAALGTWQYVRAGYFSARLFWPIALASIPAAFLGGYLVLPPQIYGIVTGIILVYSAWRLWRSTMPGNDLPGVRADLPLWSAALLGAIIGFVSGLIGVGGGIFLGPVLILAGWADTKQTLGITAAFVLVNSIAGLLGRLTAVPDLPANLWLWLLAAGLGGFLGARLGSRRLDPRVLRRLLALVLLVGGLRLLLNV